MGVIWMKHNYCTLMCSKLYTHQHRGGWSQLSFFQQMFSLHQRALALENWGQSQTQLQCVNLVVACLLEDWPVHVCTKPNHLMHNEYARVHSYRCVWNTTITMDHLLASFHIPLSTSNIHMSLKTTSWSVRPRSTSSIGCSSPVKGPAMQQAAWPHLARGLWPWVSTLLQCWQKHAYIRKKVHE